MTLLGPKPLNPKLDVTNDLYGWSDFPSHLIKLERQGAIPGNLPVVGSRYQTASQAAFALGAINRVTLIPRDDKQMAEWPNLAVSDGQGPAWPKLLTSVLFVADNRYDAGPEFPGARCRKLESLKKMRGPFSAREIHVWRCEP